MARGDRQHDTTETDKACDYTLCAHVACGAQKLQLAIRNCVKFSEKYSTSTGEQGMEANYSEEGEIGASPPPRTSAAGERRAVIRPKWSAWRAASAPWSSRRNSEPFTPCPSLVTTASAPGPKLSLPDVLYGWLSHNA